MLTSVSEEVECSAQSMCVTSDGYAARLQEAVTSIKLLAREEVWGGDEDEYEDSNDVIAILQRISTSRKKGKRRS